MKFCTKCYVIIGFNNQFITLILLLYKLVYELHSPAEILGSNPTGGMDICMLWVSCVVR